MSQLCATLGSVPESDEIISNDIPRPEGRSEDRSDVRMPRWLPRAMVLALALVACFQLATWGFHQLITLLLNVLIAFFLALAVEPAVDWMAARGMRRGLATGLVFVSILVAAAGFFALLGSMLAGQIANMVEEFPQYLDSVISWINSTLHTHLSRVEVQNNLLKSDWLQKYVQDSANNVLAVSATVLGSLFNLLTVALFSFYFAADGPGCGAPCAPCSRRTARRRCCARGRSPSPRPAVTSTPAA